MELTFHSALCMSIVVLNTLTIPTVAMGMVWVSPIDPECRTDE